MSDHPEALPPISRSEAVSSSLGIADASLLRHSGSHDELVIERAKGTRVWDRDGREYLDFTSGQLCATFGHNRDELRDAILASFERAVHSSSHFLSEEVIRLAERLIRLFPPALSKVTLLNTGSEATEVGLKAANGVALLSVKDEGYGIPAAEQERIFGEFYRVESGEAQRSAGSGLGLSLVKNTVEAHGGRVRVESEVGRGSLFVVEIPTHGVST